MECPGCSQDRKQADFFGKLRCYKCIYEEKLKVNLKKNMVKKCGICDKLLTQSQKRYCSLDCVYESQRLHNENYWTRHIKAEKVVWN